MNRLKILAVVLACFLYTFLAAFGLALRWAGCFVGIHYSGRKGLGMYGDANRCSHCGADGYGLIVLIDEGKNYEQN